jgi:hypothetical protein
MVVNAVNARETSLLLPVAVFHSTALPDSEYEPQTNLGFQTMLQKLPRFANYVAKITYVVAITTYVVERTIYVAEGLPRLLQSLPRLLQSPPRLWQSQPRLLQSLPKLLQNTAKYLARICGTF